MLRSRLAQIVPVVLGVSILTFLLLNLLPGNVALVILGEGASPAAVKALERQDGLNQPLWERYWHWLTNAVHGNLGTSLITNQGVSHLIMHAVPVTLEVIVVAQVVSLALAVPSALVAVLGPRRLGDRVLGMVNFLGISAPPFLWGIVLILVFSVRLHLLPATGWVPITQSPLQNLRSVILPAATLGIGEYAFHTRILRGDMLEQLREEYVSTARAKGAGRLRVMVAHVLRNSVFVLITVVGVNIGKLISGAVIVETLFALPGVGNLLITSISSRDINVVQGVVVFVAVAFVLINTAVDLLYSVIDPRIRVAGVGG